MFWSFYLAPKRGEEKNREKGKVHQPCKSPGRGAFATVKGDGSLCLFSVPHSSDGS
jgi:hypothetical protein